MCDLHLQDDVRLNFWCALGGVGMFVCPFLVSTQACSDLFTPEARL